MIILINKTWQLHLYIIKWHLCVVEINQKKSLPFHSENSFPTFFLSISTQNRAPKKMPGITPFGRRSYIFPQQRRTRWVWRHLPSASHEKFRQAATFKWLEPGDDFSHHVEVVRPLRGCCIVLPNSRPLRKPHGSTLVGV